MSSRKKALSHASSQKSSHASTRSAASTKYSRDHILYSEHPQYRPKPDEQVRELNVLHSPDNRPPKSHKKWVSPQLIKPILNSLITSISNLEIQRQETFEMTRQLRSLQHLTSYNNSSNISLPQLHSDFWSIWAAFKAKLIKSVQPAGASSYIRSQLSKASDILTASEDQMSDDQYDSATFDYVFDKIDAIYDSLQSEPDLHSCKRVFTVVAQQPNNYFTEQASAEMFLRRIRRCIKALITIEDSAPSIVEEVNEAELALKDLVPESLTKVRGKSVSSVKQRGPPSCAKATNLRSLKTAKYASDRRSVTPPARAKRASDFVSLAAPNKNAVSFNEARSAGQRSNRTFSSSTRNDRNYSRSVVDKKEVRETVSTSKKPNDKLVFVASTPVMHTLPK